MSEDVYYQQMNQSAVLHAELEDGEIVTGESKIPYYGKKINRVF